jgi:hypothetical protein
MNENITPEFVMDKIKAYICDDNGNIVQNKLNGVLVIINYSIVKTCYQKNDIVNMNKILDDKGSFYTVLQYGKLNTEAIMTWIRNTNDADHIKIAEDEYNKWRAQPSP